MNEETNHLSEEQLVLHFYGEAAAAGAVEDHLAACADCRARLEALRQVLAQVETAPVPERGAGYGRQVWARLEPQLPERSRPAWWDVLLWSPQRWALAGTMVALLAAAFLLRRFWQPPAGQLASPQVRERILLVAVGEHLERSEMVLVELANAQGNGTVDISAEREWAEELVESNRLYRLTAAQAGEAGVASVLDDLERILLEIANSPETLSSPDFEELRRRIESKGILFKVRVIGSQVRERERATAEELRTGRT